MKRILTVYTGGTICSVSGNEGRELDLQVAKREITANFFESESEYAKLTELFEDSLFPCDMLTLSENMTLSKLEKIAVHVKGFFLDRYQGVIIMHGTDTLAYSAAFMSLLFSDTPVPIMMVSGNMPPMQSESNANANFRAAVELIMQGIAPNVYVPYRNSDGKIYVHLGARIMQCRNYSYDFFSAGKMLSAFSKELFFRCSEYSMRRSKVAFTTRFCEGVKLIHSYTGLDYSEIRLDATKAVVHSSYHSGTVCVEGDCHSILYLAEKCKQREIPLFVAPCKLGEEQYSSTYKMARSGLVTILDMTTEMAYAKLIVGLSCGFIGEELKDFMLSRINNEFIS